LLDVLLKGEGQAPKPKWVKFGIRVVGSLKSRTELDLSVIQFYLLGISFLFIFLAFSSVIPLPVLEIEIKSL